MTRDELLIEVAQDVKWLKQATEDNAQFNSCDHKQIIEHLAQLNSKTSDNTHGIDTNRKAIAGLGGVIVIIITILLHLMGVY